MLNSAVPFLFVVLLLAFIFIFYALWRRYCIDMARQHMFEARADLFMLAANRRLSFESREYRIIRKEIEKLIRFCHILTWWRLLVYTFLPEPPNSISPKSEFPLLVINGINDEELRENVKYLYLSAVMASLLCIASRSVILFPLVAILYLIGCFRMRFVPERIVAAIQRDADIYDAGPAPLQPVRIFSWP
jgi:hypothetical protein